MYSESGKKIPGLFKDEAASEIISEFVGLRSKMYSFTFASSKKGQKTAKGVKKNIIDKELSHEDFKNTLFSQDQLEHTFNTILSKVHNVSTSTQKKVSLSSFDDKRYLVNNIDSLPYGHYSLL